MIRDEAVNVVETMPIDGCRHCIIGVPDVRKSQGSARAVGQMKDRPPRARELRNEILKALNNVVQ